MSPNKNFINDVFSLAPYPKDYRLIMAIAGRGNMEKGKVLKALKELREGQTKRNFSQGVDLIINLQNLDLKKPENQIELYIPLLHGKGKKNKVCALVGPELRDDAEKVCDGCIAEKDFEAQVKDSRKLKKLADEYEFFIAQANIMPKVATVFGRVFGPRRKMPNPKAGCIVPPKTNLAALVEKLRKTVKAVAKDRPLIQVSVGNEAMDDEKIAENAMVVYNQVYAKLPLEKNNVKSIYLKFTMGKPKQVM